VNTIFITKNNGYSNPLKAKKEKSAGLIYADRYESSKETTAIILRIIKVLFMKLFKAFVLVLISYSCISLVG
jgi:hypothetical protein